ALTVPRSILRVLRHCALSRRPPLSPLFPYTTLFRSLVELIQLWGQLWLGQVLQIPHERLVAGHPAAAPQAAGQVGAEELLLGGVEHAFHVHLQESIIHAAHPASPSTPAGGTASPSRGMGAGASSAALRARRPRNR